MRSPWSEQSRWGSYTEGRSVFDTNHRCPACEPLGTEGRILFAPPVPERARARRVEHINRASAEGEILPVVPRGRTRRFGANRKRMAIKARGFHTLAVVASPQAAYTLRLTELQWFKVVPSGTPSLFSNLRFPLLLYIGAKKAHFSPSMRMHLKRQYFRTDRAISSRQRLGTHPQQTSLNQQPLWTPGENE